MAIIGNRTILPLPVEEHPGGTVSISASSRRTLELLLPRGGVTIREFEHTWTPLLAKRYFSALFHGTRLQSYIRSRMRREVADPDGMC